MNPVSEEPGTVQFDRVVGTSHSSLMTHTLYQSLPERATFTDKILERLTIDPERWEKNLTDDQR